MFLMVGGAGPVSIAAPYLDAVRSLLEALDSALSKERINAIWWLVEYTITSKMYQELDTKQCVHAGLLILFLLMFNTSL